MWRVPNGGGLSAAAWLALNPGSESFPQCMYISGPSRFLPEIMS